MIEVLSSLLNLINKFINGIYNFQLELTENVTIKVGDLAVLFITAILMIYFSLMMINKKQGGDD